MKIHKFIYDGFGGTCDKTVMMKYDVEFVRWTNDPGIFIGKCSDGKERIIPTFAVVGDIDLPPQPKEGRVLFGKSGSSK